MRYDSFERIPKFCGVWKKLRPVTQERWLRTLLDAYVDEDTKRHPAPKAGAIAGLGGADGLVAERDYTPFASGIWVFGHLADRLGRGGLPVFYAQPRDVVGALSDWWVGDRRDSAIKAHHVTGSFDPRIAKELHQRGYPVDAMLLASLHQTLAQFGARYYPDATLGFIVGCHHDRPHPHFHAVIHPETSNGKLIRFSGLKDGEQGDDKFEFLRDSFNRRARQLFVGLTQQLGKQVAPATLGAKQWALLCRDAMLKANPDSLDASYVAAGLLAQTVNAVDFGSRLNEAARSANEQYNVAQPGHPDPDHVRRRWREIGDDWANKSARVREAGRTTFTTLASSRGPATYRPVCALQSPPAPPCFGDYRALVERESSGAPVNTIQEAFRLRLAASDRTRAKANAALKAYRAAIEQSWRDRDALLVQTGFGVSQNEFYASLNFRIPLDLADAGGTPEQALPRMLPSLRNTETFAEREMAVIAEREAEVHMPADPSETPSVLASRHFPRFRDLGLPTPELQPSAPKISL